MLETERLDDLFSLLKEMTRPGISYPKFARLLDMWDVLMYSLIMLIVLFMFPGPFAWQHGPGVTPSELDDIRLFAGQLFEGSLGFFLMTLIVSLLYIIWHRKQLVPYIARSNMFISPKNALHRDAQFITELLKFDKATLALACFNTVIVGRPMTTSYYSLATCGRLGYFQQWPSYSYP